ncbi:hypothetical protein FQN60_003556 [Etheostoma spectabile]|uniref:Secreted protein n=1 Tax=Etheostoma spectabile TaxID=54343 RepID=A0A5J5CRL9_9PERO|nr:hypothetical protein FQN60_003556 [Etheostoma spectabile]
MALHTLSSSLLVLVLLFIRQLVVLSQARSRALSITFFWSPSLILPFRFVLHGRPRLCIARPPAPSLRCFLTQSALVVGDVILLLCRALVHRDTFRMPLASSRGDPICGTPRGAGGIPVSSNLPSGCCPWSWLFPSKTWMRTPGGWRVGGEDLRLFGGDGGVAFNQRRHDSSGRLDAQGQRRHVQQQQILNVAEVSPGEWRPGQRHRRPPPRLG